MLWETEMDALVEEHGYSRLIARSIEGLGYPFTFIHTETECLKLKETL